MSIQAIEWALHHAPVTSPAEHIVLLALADRADEHGEAAWPSQEWIAERARCTTRTVRRHLQSLEERGLIHRGDQRRAAHLPANYRPIVWNLSMTVTAEADPGAEPALSTVPAEQLSTGRTRVSGRTSGAARPDTGVRADRTRVSYKPSLNHPRTVPPTARTCAPEPTRTAQAPTAPRVGGGGDLTQPTQPARLAALAAACRTRGLAARWDRLRPEQETAIIDLLDLHGVDALAETAARAHRDSDPTRYAQGWLATWAALPTPRPARPAPRPRCGECDEHGWLPDDEHGRAVRCPCRQPIPA